jgi:hypothetical protein
MWVLPDQARDRIELLRLQDLRKTKARKARAKP